MKPGLDETAWKVVSGFYQCLAEKTSSQSYRTIEISEAVRLAGLTHVINSKPLDEPYFFSNISYEAQRIGVSQDVVTKLASEALESNRSQVQMNLRSEEIVPLLGIIHSIGCYSLPLSLNRGTSQKPLGAYYTPYAIADYIVTLTLSPKLDRLAERAAMKGLSSLEDILSLKTLDPACGTGVFLVSAFNAFMRAITKGIQNALKGGTSHRILRDADIFEYRQKIRQNLFGVDLDYGALEVTDVSLRLLSQSDSKNLDKSSIGRSLKQGNSLISLKGKNGNANHSRFFADPNSRTPFEWQDEFFDILNHGGFDFIVMNPPYERLKPNLAEFLRERLLTGEREIHIDSFSSYKQRMNEDVLYFRNSGEYTQSNRYSIDTYRLFLERALQLTSEGSNIGFVVPSTILGDLSAYQLRKSIINKNKLLTIDEFPESSKLFEGVTQSVTVMTLERGSKTKSILARFGLENIGETNTQAQIRIPADQIERTVGPTLPIPQVDKVGWRLISKLHLHPSISSLDSLSVNRGELDLTLNRDCITFDSTDFRLVRGSNISRYSILDKTGGRIEYVNIDRLKHQLGGSTRAKHINHPRIAGQQISNRIQRWRLKFAPVPDNNVLANSCNYIIEHETSHDSMRLFLLGILNSELMNWRFSLTNTNNHVSTRELSQLPIAEVTSPRFRELRSMLIEEVRRHKTNFKSYRVEALVFALYGLSVKESKHVLKLRYTPKEETHNILNELEKIID